MAQQLPTDWVVRVVGPDDKVAYFLVTTNAASVARETVKNRLRGVWADWHIDGEPMIPNRI